MKTRPAATADAQCVLLCLPACCHTGNLRVPLPPPAHGKFVNTVPQGVLPWKPHPLQASAPCRCCLVLGPPGSLQAVPVQPYWWQHRSAQHRPLIHKQQCLTVLTLCFKPAADQHALTPAVCWCVPAALLLLCWLQGVFAPNERLLHAVRLFEGQVQGPGEQPCQHSRRAGARAAGHHRALKISSCCAGVTAVTVQLQCANRLAGRSHTHSGAEAAAPADAAGTRQWRHSLLQPVCWHSSRCGQASMLSTLSTA